MKNPCMSFWLSCANTCASTLRGFWMGEFQRQQSMMRNTMMKNWLDLLTPPPAVPVKKRHTRR